MSRRRRGVLDNLAKSKSGLAAKRLQSLPPSARYLFGDEVGKIKDSLQLTASLKKDGYEFTQRKKNSSYKGGRGGAKRSFRKGGGDKSDRRDYGDDRRDRYEDRRSDRYDYKADRGGKKSTKKPRGGGKGK